MKKTIILILVLVISNSISGQNRDVEYDFYNEERSYIEINEIFNFPILNLSESKIITELKKKLNTELNTVASIMVHYKFARTLKLNSDEQTELENRMVEISNKFAENKKYVLFKISGGYAPVFGIKEDIVSDKKVLTLMLGGDCTIDDVEIKEKKIYKIFNDQMKINIAE
tara:strand:- start:883 stop:1392 length:510 start_codon:yes stop_codon:yes gene_type:complete